MNMISIRKLAICEYDKYQHHLLALDKDSRYLRFASHVSDEVIIKFVKSIKQNPTKHIIFVIENDTLDVIGVGHISLEGEMELAFSVLKEYQRKGYGSALTDRCIDWCRNRGLRTGFMIFLQSNAAIKHIAIKHGLKLKSEYGETTALIDLPESNIKTFMNEAVAVNYSAFDYVFKSNKWLVANQLNMLT